MTTHTADARSRVRFAAGRFIGTAAAAGVLVGSLVVGSVLPASASAASASAASANAASAPGARAAASGLDYVALGDSYSAGLGLTPLTELPTAECGQSAVNFPHQVATAHDVKLTDVTCSGAETGDVTVDGQFGDIPPQIAALSADTDVVTLTIGGNDLGFADIVQSCLAQTADGPLTSPSNDGVVLPNCRAGYVSQGVDSLAVKISSEVAPSLAATYAAISAAAPNATIFVVGYPSLFPESVPAAGCFTSLGSQATTFPFTTVDTSYLHSVESTLDAAIQTAAATAGFSYVPSFASSFGHDACATDGSAYVNDVRLAGESLDPSTLHPNTLGAAFLADSVSTALDEAFPAPVVAPSTPNPVDTNTGIDGGLVAGGIALAVLLLAGVAFVVVARRRSL